MGADPANGNVWIVLPLRVNEGTENVGTAEFGVAKGRPEMPNDTLSVIDVTVPAKEPPLDAVRRPLADPESSMRTPSKIPGPEYEKSEAPCE